MIRKVLFLDVFLNLMWLVLIVFCTIYNNYIPFELCRTLTTSIFLFYSLLFFHNIYN